MQGFYQIIPNYSLAYFDESELEILLSGTPNIDSKIKKTDYKKI